MSDISATERFAESEIVVYEGGEDKFRFSSPILRPWKKFAAVVGCIAVGMMVGTSYYTPYEMALMQGKTQFLDPEVLTPGQLMLYINMGEGYVFMPGCAHTTNTSATGTGVVTTLPTGRKPVPNKKPPQSSTSASVRNRVKRFVRRLGL